VSAAFIRGLAVVVLLLQAPGLLFAAETFSPWVSELRLGGAASASGGGQSGYAYLEALFAPLPPVATYDPTLSWLLTPRPFVGAAISMLGRTNEAYAGFAWSPPLPAPFFLDVSFGGLVHDQRLFEHYPDRPLLTTRFLFREAVSVGMEIDEQWRVMAFADHGSNGNLGYRNIGVNRVGVMLGGKLAPSSKEVLPAPSVSSFNWNGPYAGLSAGIATGPFDFTIHEPGAESLPVNGSGFSVSLAGQVGYNWIFGPLVLGVEGSASKQGLDSSASRQQPLDEQISAAVPWLATARLRIGVDTLVLSRRFLIYATGGAAVARIARSYCQQPGNPCYINGDVAGGWVTEGGVRKGWTVGAGLESPLAPGISTRIEYLYADFGMLSYVNGPITNDLTFHEHILRAGINFHLAGI
jgi:lipid A 3-O-deacylase